MDLGEVFASMQSVVEPIIESSRTTFEWWSASVDYNLADRNKVSFERHWKYPTIEVLVYAPSDDNTMVQSVRLGQASHQGSCKIALLEDTDLEAEASDSYVAVDGVLTLKKGDINWSLKRLDKLVGVEDGETYYIIEVVRAAARTHVSLGLAHAHVLEATYNS